MVVARLETAGVICLETFKDFPRMARFILRDEGQYIVPLMNPSSLLQCRENHCYWKSVEIDVAVIKREGVPDARPPCCQTC